MPLTRIVRRVPATFTPGKSRLADIIPVTLPSHAGRLVVHDGDHAAAVPRDDLPDDVLRHAVHLHAGTGNVPFRTGRARAGHSGDLDGDFRTAGAFVLEPGHLLL